MVDTTTVTTVVTQTSFLKTIQSNLDSTHWFLLFLGWLMYWLKVGNTTRMTCVGKPIIQAFWAENFIELPSSAIACIVLAVIAKSIPTDLVDLHGLLAVFMVGYTSSSVLNGLITMAKPTVK